MNDIEEAIELLDKINSNARSKHMAKDCFDGVTAAEIKEYREDFRLIKVAIKVLEKQVPRKPTTRMLHYECSECSNRLETLSEYCGDCGQKLDWSEE